MLVAIRVSIGFAVVLAETLIIDAVAAVCLLGFYAHRQLSYLSFVAVENSSCPTDVMLVCMLADTSPSHNSGCYQPLLSS